ncbi:diguanylate cyclase [Aliiroseovarius sp. KMU-50]|uniref:diguanylate cyclase n=1 Tax=Aliiroseovarius salicola TaxID=3009082 RepID=A0ABT4W0S7_9RHOB|nr:diguanylate cyclase [Aliiroseovarius sp. KMU-50]MDA5094117.1 diguanylate cyclase [Aliiroseovarius sp. KMU-50]
MSGRILIADDVATNRIVLKVKLTTACYDVVQAATVSDVLSMAQSDYPDLILLGQTLQGGGGIEACRQIKKIKSLETIPVVIISPVGGRGNRLMALRAGADDFLTKPLEESTMLATVRNLMRDHTAREEVARRQILAAEMGFSEPSTPYHRQPRIALLAPAVDTGLMWRKALTQEMGQTVTVLNKGNALEDSRRKDQVPDVFIISTNISEKGDGLRLVSELRSRMSTRHSIILFIDEDSAGPNAAMALDLGANAVLSGYFDAEEIAVRLAPLIPSKFLSDRLRNTVDERLSLAVTDPLTGLYNRRYAASYLERLETQSSVTGKGFAIMLMDLDRFKSINDCYGHFAGDEVLIETANRLKSSIRDMDLLARYGGEEFLIAMPDTNHDDALKMAERLRRVIGDTPIHASSVNTGISVTMSIGVAMSYPGQKQTGQIQEMLQSADRALYASKAEGRNQVTFVQSAA